MRRIVVLVVAGVGLAAAKERKRGTRYSGWNGVPHAQRGPQLEGRIPRGAPQRREARRLRRAARYSEPVQRTRGGAGLRAERGLALP